jgi:dethiobiotin synthase
MNGKSIQGLENRWPGLFVTGTGTGVGKTTAAAALLAAARHQGIDAAPVKPVQTGAEEHAHGRTAPDLDFCLRMSGMQPAAGLYDLMAPYRFLLPASPHLAARVEGQRVAIEEILKACSELAHTYRFLIAEGAGGILVPLNERTTMIDLAVEMGFPVVVAARPTLGTLNHTLLTLHALRGAGLSVAGVVMVETGPKEWGAIEQDNLETIAGRGEVNILGKIPFLAGLGQSETLPPPLLDAGLEILEALARGG